MSLYKGEDVKLTVTTGNDGSRSFGPYMNNRHYAQTWTPPQHDDRWNSGPRNHRRRGRGGGGGGGSQYHSDNYRGGYQSRGGYRGGGKSRGGYRGGHRQGPYHSHNQDPDGDVAMGGDNDQGSHMRYNPYGSRPRSQRGRRPDHYSGGGGSGKSLDALQRLGLPVSEQKGSGWFKVVIPYGKNLEKDQLLKMLNDRLTVPFIPIGFTFEGKVAIFYVNGQDSAQALRSLTNRLTFPNGRKLVIIVKSSSTPNTPMDDNSVAKLQECMSKRYDPTTKALDLSRMYSDEGLNQAGVYVVLNRPQNMEKVIKVIGEHIPELQGLDLSHNRLLSLTPLTGMIAKAPHITKLSLAGNQLRSVDELEKIKGWSLEEIILEGNDFCGKFPNQPAYVSAVRDKFPKILKLDGIVLPPPITFDVETTCTVPAVKGSFFLNPEIQEPVVKFLKEYFTVYDSDNRQGLAPAYHENGLFSMSVAYNPTDNHQPKLNDYMAESRNLLKRCASNSEMRSKLLRQGRVNIVSSLCLLPKSTHDPNSLLVDVSFASEKLLSFTVSGLFKETDCRADKPPIRAFSRVMCTVPWNGGMLIINDMLTISNATPEQSRSAFKNTGPTPSSSPVSATPQPPVPAQATPPAAPPALAAPPSMTPEQQQQMVLSFSQQSGMNAEWSAQCLEQNSWDYEKSAQVFTTLNAEGKIPPEAFVK